MNKKKRFNKIADSIRKIKIQGAGNIAKSALYAYSLMPKKSSKKKLLSLRPTEPMLRKVLSLISRQSKKEILEHFDFAQNKINKSVSKLIKSCDTIFTHCHSASVVKSLIYSYKKGKHFEVYNTETRPLFQGRRTARELRRAGIKTTMFIDSASAIAIEKASKRDKIHSDKIFLGADALLEDGIINKIGSGMIAELAHINKIPVYIIADSWKYSDAPVPIEIRSKKEVWTHPPKRLNIFNPAFEFVKKEHITGIVSEFGLMKYDKFVGKMKKRK